jgi:hypothetical protein
VLYTALAWRISRLMRLGRTCADFAAGSRFYKELQPVGSCVQRIGLNAAVVWNLLSAESEMAGLSKVSATT